MAAVGEPSRPHCARNEWRARAGAELHRGPPLHTALVVMENQRDEAQQLVRLAQHQLLEAMNVVRSMRGYAPLSELPQPPYCSFCGRAKSEVGALVEGLNAHICGECAAEARHLLLRG